MEESPTVPIARPLLGADEIEAARRVISSGWVMQGPEVEAFEREFASFVGSAHACAVSSGTAALHLALLALGIGPGDEVVTVSHSFIATANSICLVGATPVFVDIEPNTFNIDVTQVERILSARTRAILCVHQMGMPCDLVALSEMARRRGLWLIEDAACAAGSEIAVDARWERVGAPRGHLACFSFHPRKVMTTGEGGMLVAASAEHDLAARRLRQHGSATGDAQPAVVGLNYRMTDLQAAIGRVQLRRLPALVAERRQLAARYRERLATLVPDIVMPFEPDWARSNWQSFCVRLPSRLSPEGVARDLAARGIVTRGAIANAHQLPPHRSRARTSMVHSEQAAARCLMLPLYAGLSSAQEEHLYAVLSEACA